MSKSITPFKDRHKLANSKYYANNKEEIQARQAIYRALNRADINANQRAKRTKQ